MWFLYLLWAALAAGVFIVFAVKAMSEKQEKRMKRNLRSIAKVDPESGEFVVRQPAPGKWSNALIVLWLTVLVLLFVAAILSPDGPAFSDVVQDLGMILLAGVLIFSIRVGVMRFHVSDSGIRAVPLLGKPHSVPWADVDSVGMSALPRAFVLKAGKKKMLIPLSYEGLNSLSSHIVKHVPPDRRKEANGLLAESLGYKTLPEGIAL